MSGRTSSESRHGVSTKELRWESYVKAGYYDEHPVPVDLLVTGTVPAGSGLPSSAAMVVASSLGFLVVNDKLDHHAASPIHKLTKEELVWMAMENEKRPPSQSLYPPKSVFVCANSLVVSDKAVTAKHRYNLRVVETLIGARILAREVVGRFAGEEDETELSVEELQETLAIRHNCSPLAIMMQVSYRSQPHAPNSTVFELHFSHPNCPLSS
ncbi:hypothetical protein F5887DRAFT_1084359 [Amanita rubescens]|nr:hypothetical protein F5887DRAFT_1084359 [Amanita rubescens]